MSVSVSVFVSVSVSVSVSVTGEHVLETMMYGQERETTTNCTLEKLIVYV